MNVHKKLFSISLVLIACFFLSLLYITNQENAFPTTTEVCGVPLLIIDAGHGGEDGGAIAIDGTYEKDINLQIALQLQEICSLFGMDSIMIRTTDTDLADHTLPTIRKRKISDINARMEILNSNPHAVYVGIHQNQYKDARICGLQVFYSNGTDISRQIADSVQVYTSSSLQPDNTRKTKAAGEDIYLLHHAKLPAIMVECGFISNEEECRLLKEPDYGTKISLCIAGGLMNYYTTERIA
ncbi:MAG: N-acetylmuramoyl-L-alanine amidase [Clostridia bacterium]|nr:N-acetylmuramoyl-L-alanine amidase [Clostridia bacterium]